MLHSISIMQIELPYSVYKTCNYILTKYECTTGNKEA